MTSAERGEDDEDEEEEEGEQSLIDVDEDDGTWSCSRGLLNRKLGFSSIDEDGSSTYLLQIRLESLVKIVESSIVRCRFVGERERRRGTPVRLGQSPDKIGDVERSGEASSPTESDDISTRTEFEQTIDILFEHLN